MADNGIRSSNLPQGPLIEVLGHADAGGGRLTTSRMSVGDFVNLLLGLATGEASAVASLAAALTQEIRDRSAAQEALEEAIQGNLNALGTSDVRLASNLQAEVDARHLAMEDLSRLLEAEIAANGIAALTSALGGMRPGICPAAFSAELFGSIVTTPPLDQAGLLTTPLGRAYRVAGAGLIAPRAAIPWDPDEIWVIQARYWRDADVHDPNNSALDLGIQWLDANDRDAGQTLLRREANLRVQDGPHMLEARVPSTLDSRVAIAAPKSAVSWKPFIRTWGADGATAVQVLGASNATFAGVYAPDLEALTARLRNIEGRIAAGLPLSTQAPTAFAVADLPAPNPQSPGRRAWARDGRARQADGTLEPANAGTGVSVEDNGRQWVIPGTNTKVTA